MGHPHKRTVAALLGNGRVGLVTQDLPALKPGAVLVEVHASLVSPGTELGGWPQLLAEAANPKPDFKPRPFGYANAGVVVQTGDGVADLKVGDRVACMGAGYAQHADFAVVPHRLCALLPEAVSFEQGAYAHLAATALQAVRRAGTELGEFFAVVGLGLVGQLTAQLLQLDGCFACGWDTVETRLRVARKWGIAAALNPLGDDLVAQTVAFTGGLGLDGAVLAFGGPGRKAYEQTVQCLKKSPDGHRMGRIVVVGGVLLDLPYAPANFDLRWAARTGPGYHDDPWEYGPDYPAVFMRWTTRTNLQLCLRLMAERRLKTDLLTTHRIPLADVQAGIAAIIGKPERILGVVFTMK